MLTKLSESVDYEERKAILMVVPPKKKKRKIHLARVQTLHSLFLLTTSRIVSSMLEITLSETTLTCLS